MTRGYWHIDIPGLTHELAARFRERLLQESPWGIHLMDPAEAMVRGYDRPTVELMVKCLEAGLEYGDLAHLDRMGAMSMLEDCQVWLEET